MHSYRTGIRLAVLASGGVVGQAALAGEKYTTAFAPRVIGVIADNPPDLNRCDDDPETDLPPCPLMPVGVPAKDTSTGDLPEFDPGSLNDSLRSGLSLATRMEASSLPRATVTRMITATGSCIPVSAYHDALASNELVDLEAVVLHFPNGVFEHGLLSTGRRWEATLDVPDLLVATLDGVAVLPVATPSGSLGGLDDPGADDLLIGSEHWLHDAFLAELLDTWGAEPWNPEDCAAGF